MSTERIPEGYKKTKMGVIPDDWECVQLGDLAIRVGSGITPTGGERVYTSEGRPFIRSQNVGWGKLELDDLTFIPEHIHTTFTASEIKEGDVLLNITGASIGRSAVADKRIAGGNVNQHVCEIRLDQTKLEPLFVSSFLLSETGQRQIDSFQAGGNRQGLNYHQIRSFLIPLPPLPEQRAIAAALGDVDALLAALDTLIAKKRAVKTAAMQALLTGRVRLPGFSGEWVTRRLGEVGECLRGVSYKPDTDLFPSDSPFTIRLLRANNIQDDHLDLADLQFVNAERISEKQVLQSDDIVVCMANGSKDLVGKAAFFDLHDGHSYSFGAFMGCFRVFEKNYAYPIFVSYLFQTKRYRNEIEIILSGSSINNLKPSDIESIEFLFPSLREQRAIAAVLADMDAEIAALEARREKVRQIKQGMMQVLLTGKVRLVGDVWSTETVIKGNEQ